MFRGDVINKKNYSVPLVDIRTNPSPKLDWDQLLNTRKQMLQAYQIMKTHILSRLTPTNLRDLRDKLVYNYYISNAVVDDLINFIQHNDTKSVEFAEKNGCLVSDELYLKPIIKLSCPIGPYSVFLPNLR